MTENEEAELREWLKRSPEQEADNVLAVARAKGCHLPKGDISRRILKNEIAEAIRAARLTDGGEG